jgi:hypothetical protein
MYVRLSSLTREQVRLESLAYGKLFVLAAFKGGE